LTTELQNRLVLHLYDVTQTIREWVTHQYSHRMRDRSAWNRLQQLARNKETISALALEVVTKSTSLEGAALLAVGTTCGRIKIAYIVSSRGKVRGDLNGMPH
jgi:hypothetical protein